MKKKDTMKVEVIKTPNRTPNLRARNVINEALELISQGVQPNFYQLQLKHGYTPSSAKAYLVKKTKEWQMVMDKLDDTMAMDRLVQIVKEGKDADSLKAIDMQMKLKSRYPTKLTANLTVNRKIEGLYD